MLILLQAVTAFTNGEKEYASYLSGQVFFLPGIELISVIRLSSSTYLQM